jgi:hypothetical protein
MDVMKKKMAVQWGSPLGVIDFKETCDLVRREALYSILSKFGIPMDLIRPIEMC